MSELTVWCDVKDCKYNFEGRCCEWNVHVGNNKCCEIYTLDDSKKTVDKPNEKCHKCKNNGTAICNRCYMFYDEFDPIDKPLKTNYELVISKTPEELADFLYDTWKEQDKFKKDVCESCPDTSCQPKCWLDWLRQKAKEENDGK